MNPCAPRFGRSAVSLGQAMPTTGQVSSREAATRVEARIAMTRAVDAEQACSGPADPLDNADQHTAPRFNTYCEAPGTVSNSLTNRDRRHGDDQSRRAA